MTVPSPAANKRRLLFAANALIVFVCLLILWWAIVLVFHVPNYMLPTPWKVADTVITRIPDLWDTALITAEAAAIGFFASVVIGILVALLFARSNWIRSMFLPYTILLQTVPIIAVTPLIIMWIGPSIQAVALVTFIICLAPIIANATQGLISVDEGLIQLFLMHNASQAQILRKLRLPHSLPYLFVGLRISSGIAVIGAITGEIFAGSGQVGRGGLGYSIIYAMQQLQTDYLFALVLAATLLGFSFFFLVTFFEWLALHNWHESSTSTHPDA
jgi:NitT/TauT family transport system permease protein